MSPKNRKQFGVWMDTHHATVIGRADPGSRSFAVVGHAGNPRSSGDPDEKTAHHHDQAALHRFFKEIASHLTNADEVHVTGTGTAQEQFIHFLADTPQFRNTATTEDTSIRMSDEDLVELVTGRFH